jgi:hypothetical protein
VEPLASQISGQFVVSSNLLEFDSRFVGEEEVDLDDTARSGNMVHDPLECRLVPYWIYKGEPSWIILEERLLDCRLISAGIEDNDIYILKNELTSGMYHGILIHLHRPFYTMQLDRQPTHQTTIHLSNSLQSLEDILCGFAALNIGGRFLCSSTPGAHLSR